MSSVFDRAEQRAERAATRVFGSPVAFLGQIVGDFSVADDPARPRIDAVAITALSARVNRVADGIQGRSSTGSERLHGSDEMWMPRDAFEALEWLPGEGDVVFINPDDPNVRRFVIGTVEPLEDSDVRITLSEVRI